MKWREHNALCHRTSACDSAVMIGNRPATKAIVCSVLYTYSDTCRRAAPIRNNTVPTNLPNWRFPMPRYFFDIKNGHKLVDPSGTDCKNDTDAIDKAKRDRHWRFTRQACSRSSAPYRCDRRCGSGNFPDTCIFRAFSRTSGQVTRRRGLTLAPAADREATRWFRGFHRIEQFDHNLMDMMASGALKRPYIEARRARCDPRQPRGCLARWTWWPGMMEHDARLDQAGALQDSQSPVDAVSGR